MKVIIKKITLLPMVDDGTSFLKRLYIRLDGRIEDKENSTPLHLSTRNEKGYDILIIREIDLVNKTMKTRPIQILRKANLPARYSEQFDIQLASSLFSAKQFTDYIMLSISKVIVNEMHRAR